MDEDFDKNMTEGFSNKKKNNQLNKTIDIKDVVFSWQKFERIEKEDITITTADAENWGIMDPARYKKKDFQIMNESFLQEMTFSKF